MENSIHAERRAALAQEFDRRHRPGGGREAVGQLVDGLTLLAELLYLRLHQDVESSQGIDSLMAPVSEIKTQARVGAEIDSYQVAESAAAAEAHGYLREAGEWYRPWLARLRAGERRATDLPAWSQYYACGDADSRRRVFMDNLGRLLPESRRAPLILFRLYPMAIHIVTARAFDDELTAVQLRREQTAILPALVDCRDCRGVLCKSSASCTTCGSPLWKHDWLKMTD